MKYNVSIWMTGRLGSQYQTSIVYSGNNPVAAIYHLLFTKIYGKEIIQLTRKQH